MKIKNIKVSKILNSRNEEAIEVTVNDYFKGSSGSDGNLNTINENPSKDLSLDFINKILNKGLYDFNVESIKDILEIEEILLSYDKSEQLTKIGCNVLLSLEFALLKLVSNNSPVYVLNKHPDKFPVHICNCVATNLSEKKKLGFQEIILIPNTKNFSDAFFANMYVYRKLGSLLKTNEKTEEGSFITNQKNETVLYYLEKLTNEITKKLGIEFSFGLNVNAAAIFSNNFYRVGKENFLVNDHIKELNKLVNRFDIEYLEDPLSVENVNLIGKLKTDYVCGNRIFNSNLQNFKRFSKYFNCAVIKINQAGSLGRLKKVLDFCRNNDIYTVLGQNLGETNESIISDIAAGFEFDFIKYGLQGKERSLKLNELKRIESLFLPHNWNMLFLLITS